MPRSFCIAQTFLIYYGAFSLTGVCAAFTFATTSSVLWPSQLHSTTSSTLAWRRQYLWPMVAFPLASIAISIGVLLKYDAIHPTDDLHCDASHPEWGRFLGYAGIPMIVSLPCFFLSTAAAFRIMKMHIQRSRSRRPFSNENVLSSNRSHQRSKSSNIIDFAGRKSSPHIILPSRSPSMSKSPTSSGSGRIMLEPETETGNYIVPFSAVDEERLHGHVADDDYETGPPTSPSPVFAPPTPSNEPSLRSPPYMPFRKHSEPLGFVDPTVDHDPYKWESTKKAIDEEASFGNDIGHRRTASIPLSAAALSRQSHIPAPRSLAPAVWRLIIFQMAFFIIQCLAALSTIIDVANHRPTPTPFGTQHVALILAGWGPAVVFGHLPAVRRRLMFWKRRQ
ncbi:hypothetical protein SERLA73DRAFT_69425 [Serpula lacrymans var. lacrymans S7.3]|uniref:Uncharacterized protein n=2 Tax=Serpula lacrymans var. lacrymans TaxID=341189 RepID=F8PKM3_SERL3|nr:hypothetical protein SERLA73DRAFT_69425 [Serpula lacrymans var. lacrymans S7.3]